MRRWLAVAFLLLGAGLLGPLATTSAQGPDGDVARGEAVYQASCAMCHGADATGMMGMHPALTGAVDRLTVEGVEVTIRQGRDTRPPMPAFGDRFDEDEIADVIAYLDSLPPGPRNFGPDMGREPMGDGGMSGMMRDMMGASGMVALWIVVVVLAAALAGVTGYLVGQRRGS